MLHKELRISRGREYRFIYRNSRKISGQYMIVFLSENQMDHSRFGIVTSKKIGNAVIRNRAKRQIREAIRKNLHQMQSGYNIVVVARYNIKDIKFELIERDLLKLLRKACIII